MDSSVTLDISVYDCSVGSELVDPGVHDLFVRTITTSKLFFESGLNCHHRFRLKIVSTQKVFSSAVQGILNYFIFII